MIRAFCDSCGAEMKANDNFVEGREITGYVKSRHAGNNVVVTVAARLKDTKPTDHICLNCVIDAVNYLDKRPKADIAVERAS